MLKEYTTEQLIKELTLRLIAEGNYQHNKPLYDDLASYIEMHNQDDYVSKNGTDNS